MPLQNRVTPLGDVIATPERGLVYANRGCIHDTSGHIRDRRYPTKRWIACQLEFRGRHRRPLMAPGKFTELFFLERRDPRTRQRRFHEAPIENLPDGTFVLHENEPHLVLGAQLLTWSPAGYTDRTDRPAGGTATVITPPSLAALLRTDRTPLVPLVHPSAVV